MTHTRLLLYFASLLAVYFIGLTGIWLLHNRASGKVFGFLLAMIICLLIPEVLKWLIKGCLALSALFETP